MISIKEITVSELPAFVESEAYHALEVVPISPQRAISQFHNPRSKGSHPALFLAFDGDRFVGYLGAVPDYFYLSSDEKIEVAFLSCMWVHPQYRRSGVAFDLMTKAHDSWQGRLFITNYYKVSRAVFDKTGQYTEYALLKGHKIFYRSAFYPLLLSRWGKRYRLLQWMTKLADYMFNTFWDGVQQLLPAGNPPPLEYLSHFNPADKKLIATLNHDTAFQRADYEFDWISKFPWVIQAEVADIHSSRYFFSCLVKEFNQWWVRVYDITSNAYALALMQLRDGELTVPYMFSPDQGTSLQFANYCRYLIKRKRIISFTCFYPEVTNLVRQQSNDILWQKTVEKGFLTTKVLKDRLGSEPAGAVHPGDGDAVFT